MFGPDNIDNIQDMTDEQIIDALLTPYMFEKEKVLQAKMRGVDTNTITKMDLFDPYFFKSVRESYGQQKKASATMNYGMFVSGELQKSAGFMLPLAAGGIGAIHGGLMGAGYDNENRMRNAMIGAGAGAVIAPAALALSSQTNDLAQRLALPLIGGFGGSVTGAGIGALGQGMFGSGNAFQDALTGYSRGGRVLGALGTVAGGVGMTANKGALGRMTGKQKNTQPSYSDMLFEASQV